MKLRQRPHKSLIGFKFQFSHGHSMPFHIESPPPSRVSKCLTGSEGVKKWNRPSTTSWKIINIFQVNKWIIKLWNVHCARQKPFFTTNSSRNVCKFDSLERSMSWLFPLNPRFAKNAVRDADWESIYQFGVNSYYTSAEIKSVPFQCSFVIFLKAPL